MKSIRIRIEEINFQTVDRNFATNRIGQSDDTRVEYDKRVCTKRKNRPYVCSVRNIVRCSRMIFSPAYIFYLDRTNGECYFLPRSTQSALPHTLLTRELLLDPPPFTHTLVRYGSFISLDFPPTSPRCTASLRLEANDSAKVQAMVHTRRTRGFSFV